MGLFQKSVEKKYLNDLDPVLIDQNYQAFQAYFGNPSIQENIRNAKEEQFQEGFLRELFVSIFGYTLNPQPDFNLTTELKNIVNSRKADGAILKGEDAIAVIELKGTDTTDLDKIEAQAFGYKNHHPKCVYVITSNFEKLRFYIQNAVDHIDFDLFNLDREAFALMWLCLAKDNLLSGLPQKIKESSLLEEESISKKLYADYSRFREAIYNNLVKNNPETDKLLLFKKTQKLLDRFLFIFFAEDRLLLPPNSITEIVKQWKTLKDELDEYVPLYERFKKYFGYMNTGYKGKRYDIFPYNGGLFAPDEVLDSVSIDDEILHKHTLTLSQYDFETEVDVNILGHIFEHSLGEIENVQAEIKGEAVETQKSKRKKDGIFYTPKYITKYIVENTVGRLCQEKRAALGIDDEDYARGRRNRKKDTIKILDEKLTDYRNWLLEMTILDPACGSGAFLNQALDFLITEHRKIDDLRAQLFGGGMAFSDITMDILEKNIYGVDINEESVEIAKLSLWLRTAQKGRKLNKLNNNIKCGNSLIDDPEVAGDKAFDWQKEFPEIFAKGGFDVVIGNPPYVRVQQLDYSSIDFLKNNYKTALKRIDVSLCFIELSSKLIKNEIGFASFITSNQFLTTEYGQSMRTFLLNKYNLVECVDLGDLPVFEDALTYVSIFTFKNSNIKSFTYYHIDNLSNAMSHNYGKPQIIDITRLGADNWNLKNYASSNIWSRIFDNCKKISEIGNAWYGIITGADSVFIFSKEQYQISEIEKELFIPLLRAQNCSKYFCFEPEKFVLYPYKIEDNKTVILSENELQKKFPKGYQYLLSHKNELEQRKDSRDTFKGRPDWYCLTRFGQFVVFNQVKIVTPGEVKQHKFCLDFSNAGFSGARVFAITLNNNTFNIKYVLGILNSDLLKLYLQSFSSLKNGGFYSYSSNILNKAPIKNCSNSEQNDLAKLVDEIQSLSNDFNLKRNRFLKRLVENFEEIKITNQLNSFDELDFKRFLNELSKQKIKLSLIQQDEWEEYFIAYQSDIKNIKENIEKLDREINEKVFRLYDLTLEEKKLVEESV